MAMRPMAPGGTDLAHSPAWDERWRRSIPLFWMRCGTYSAVPPTLRPPGPAARSA